MIDRQSLNPRLALFAANKYFVCSKRDAKGNQVERKKC
jgi:hypothetical protein